MFDEWGADDKEVIDSDMRDGLFLITENSKENLETEEDQV
jgi:hypothetical protein